MQWLKRLLKSLAISLGTQVLKWAAPVALHAAGLTSAGFTLRTLTSAAQSKTGKIAARKSYDFIKPLIARKRPKQRCASWRAAGPENGFSWLPLLHE